MKTPVIDSSFFHYFLIFIVLKNIKKKHGQIISNNICTQDIAGCYGNEIFRRNVKMILCAREQNYPYCNLFCVTELFYN